LKPDNIGNFDIFDKIILLFLRIKEQKSAENAER
jgi:hypothetical protein